VQNFFIWKEDLAAAGLEKCGMFTRDHILSMLFCFLLLAAMLWVSRKWSEKTYRRVLLGFAIAVTLLECCKIGFNWAHGGWELNRWLPLTFCSFSIYAYWMMACGNDFIRALGVSFMAGGGIIGGLTFLVLPLTSLQEYPLFHFQSCYSMLFHSMMMFVGISCVMRGYFRFGRGGYRRYLSAVLPALAIALAVSLLYILITGDDPMKCNMMFLVHPYTLGDLIPFIGTIYNEVPLGGLIYCLGAMGVYATLPYFIPYGVAKLLQKIPLRRREAATAEEIA